MATYAIGDIQGCFGALEQLLREIAFDPSCDYLWFTGDLVNRGPQSLAVLRFVMGLGNRAIAVLGNHDLHLLAVAEGFGKARSGDTLAEVLDAPDRAELLNWLRQQPLMHHDQGYALVHAGLLPDWSLAQGLELAAEVQSKLRSDRYREFLLGMYGNQPDRWEASLHGAQRWRVVINAMTRLRLCNAAGAMEFRHKGALEDLPEGYVPWFAHARRASRDTPIIFGHWSALGLVLDHNVIGLDTGCLWGRQLTAIRLEDRRLFQLACPS